MSNKKQHSAAWLRPILLSAFGGVAALCAAMAFFSFLMVKLCLSANLFYPFATICICLGCLVSGMIAAQLRKSGGLACGLISFFVYTVILALAAAAAGTRSMESSAILRTALLLPAGCAGGILGVRRAEKQARHRHTA